MCYESFCCMGGCRGSLSGQGDYGIVPIVLVLQPVKIVGATNMPWFDISANEKDEKVWRDTVQHYLDDFPKTGGWYL